MKQIKQNIKMDKKNLLELFSNIFMFCFIFLFCFSNIFTKPIGDLDEIWNFNFARNIANGLVPYNDFNIIQTPLLPAICAIFLKIFGNKLIIMRLLATIMLTIIFYLGFEIIFEETKDKNFSSIFLIAILLLFKDIMAIDYNYGVLLIALIILKLELKNLKNEDYFKCDFKYNFLTGILAGITILFKHTTGIIFCIGYCGYKLFKVRNKKDLNNYCKLLLIRFLGILIPIIFFVFYLLITNSFVNFISYSILGIKYFSNSLKYNNLFNIDYVKILAILVPIVIGSLFVFQFVKKGNIFNILFGFSLATFAVTFPISDKIHFMIGSFIALISGSIFIIKFLNDSFEDNKMKKIKFIFINFVSVFLILLIGYKACKMINSDYLMKTKEFELSSFEKIPENEGLKERIKEIDEFILNAEKEGKKVYVLDAEAAIYFIPLNKYNKDYDMFLIGNLGKNGEDGIIEKIKQEKNTIYLIKKNNINWQTPIKVRNYIMNNLEKVGNKSIFYVYKSIGD